MGLIEFKGISKYYETAGERVAALQHLDLTIEAGEFVALMGPSGSGKSTLLNILGGLSRPSEGEMRVNGVNIYNLPGEKLADYRREYVGFVFQSFHLLPYLTVMENVLLPLAVVGNLRAQNARKLEANERVQACRLPQPNEAPAGCDSIRDADLKPTAREVRTMNATGTSFMAAVRFRNGWKKEQATWVLQKVGLLERDRRLPSQLSGGEQERVAIARALVNKPPIILADEPTGNLDSATGKEIMELLSDLNFEGQTIIMVTHNAENAGFAQRIIRLKDGQIQGESR